MTPMPTSEGPVGLLLAERYQLGEALGGGGSSLVYRGVDQRTKATVVLKLLEPGYAEDDPIVAHFDQEARLAARVRDPHLLGALDFGNDAGCRFIVYEYFPEMRSLRVLIDGRERVGPERAAQIALQVLSALDTLHQAGIVHRDVSPGNCLWRMRDDQDEVVLADLGCAGVMPPRPPVTGGPKPTGELYGTAYYTAPEILAGERHDHRADLWSVGALMYALLTSRDADIGEPGQWLAVKPPVQLVRAVPLALNAVVMKALAPQDRRYQSAAEMMKALRAAMRPQPPPPSSPWRGLGVGGLAGAAATAMLVLVTTHAANTASAPDERVHETPTASSEIGNGGVVEEGPSRPPSPDEPEKNPKAAPDSTDGTAPLTKQETPRRREPRHSVHASQRRVEPVVVPRDPLTWAKVEQEIRAQADALRVCSHDEFISLGVRVSDGRAVLETVDGDRAGPTGCAAEVLARLRFDSGPMLDGVVGVKLP